ncbi:MAG: hypothetical protein ACTHMM_21190 [Agriterribacter sp.]
MAQVVLKYTVQSDPNAAKTVGEMKKEFNSLRKEIDSTVQGTDEYYKKLNKLADLQANIRDLRDDVKALDPGEKLAAIGNIASGAIGAYTSLTSAVSIFAGSNEELQQQLLKVNAALGLLQGAQQVMRTLDDGKRILSALTVSTKAQTAATEGASVATKSFGTALKAAGIGLVVSIIAYLITNWDKLRDSVTKFLPFLKDTGDSFNKLKEIAYGVGNAILQYFAGPINSIVKLIQGDFKGAMEAFKKGFDFVGNYEKGAADERQSQREEAYRKALEASINAVDNEVSVLQARGKKTYDIERENLKRRLDLYKDNAEEYNKILQQIRILDATHEKQQADERQKAFEKYQADLKKRNEEIRKAEEERLKILIEANSRVLTVQQQQRLDALNEVITQGQQVTQIESHSYNERFGKYNEFAPRYIDAVRATGLQVTEEERRRAEAEISIGNQIIQHKEAVLDTTSNLLKSASQLAGQQSKASKVLMIAATLIDTYRSAQAAFTGMVSTIPGPVGIGLGVAAAAAAVASGLANVAAIKKVNPESSSVSSSAPSYQAPRIPQTAQMTTLNNQSVQDIAGATQQQQPLQVNIGIDEVTRAQNRVNTYESNSTIG